MKMSMISALALAMASAGLSYAGTIYSNTSTDTFFTYVYNAGGYTQIGDSITLGGSERTLTDATVQFYNLGTAGTFSAILSFWNVGTPVGSQIGSSYVVNGLSIGAQASANVLFPNLNLLVPNNLIFTVAVSNLDAGLVLGLNAFEPPLAGSSNNSEIITGSPFAASPTEGGKGNLFLQLEATDVPEPATVTVAGVAILALWTARRRAAR